jgi:hypothetical protein
MKTGSFQVLGQEWLNRRSPINFLAVSFGAYFIIALVIFALFEENPNSLNLFGSSLWAVYYIIIGLPVVCIAGYPLLRIYPNRLERIRLFDITYVDNTEEGGEFEIQYRDVKAEQEKRKTMIVKTITSKPKRRLDITWKVQVPKDFPIDTKIGSTLEIISKKGSRNLRLGFSSVEEMNKSLPQFGSSAKRIVTN